jgi:hypothetical protein
MELDLAKCDTPRDWLQSMTQRISRRAPKNSDNFSAAAVFINTESEGV